VLVNTGRSGGKFEHGGLYASGVGTFGVDEGDVGRKKGANGWMVGW